MQSSVTRYWICKQSLWLVGSQSTGNWTFLHLYGPVLVGGRSVVTIHHPHPNLQPRGVTNSRCLPPMNTATTKTGNLWNAEFVPQMLKEFGDRCLSRLILLLRIYRGTYCAVAEMQMTTIAITFWHHYVYGRTALEFGFVLALCRHSLVLILFQYCTPANGYLFSGCIHATIICYFMFDKTVLIF